jgi:type IV secretion system protein VirB10
MTTTPSHDLSQPPETPVSIEASLDLNPQRPGVKRLSPRMIAGLGVVALCVLTTAFVISFGGRPNGGTGRQPVLSFTPASENVIDTALTRLPEDYRFDVQDYLRPPEISPPEESERSATLDQTTASTGPSEAAALAARERQLERLRQQFEEAIDSPVVFRGVETRRNETAAVNPRIASHPQQASLGRTDPTRVAMTDDGFLARSPNNSGKRLVASSSPYEIKAGTILPGALLTAIHSDLPGVITGQVTEHVYDTASGSHLLIPQGSRLVGRYSSLVGTGQDRVLIAWDRIILPNGDSLELPTVPGTDALGRSGLADRVDYHVGRIGLATVLSTAIAYVGNLAPGNRDTDSENDVVGETVAQQASQLGQRIIDRELDLPPTVTVRPGTRFNVLVNEDLTLKPYTSSGD